jgi:hypothetical protein
MMYAKQLYFAFAIVTIAAATQANAANGNPLHPSYYWDTAPQVQIVTSDAKAYVDSRNPLHAAYPRITGNPSWLAAAHSMGTDYRNSNNPLHPSFKR